MEDHKLDFHGTFRRLCFFKPSLAASEDALKGFVDSLLELTSEPERLDHIRAQSDWSGWLRRYAARIESERDHWGADVDAEREGEAKGANPRFVLRQWVLEEVIKKVETDASSGKRILRKVLNVSASASCHVAKSWLMSLCRWLAARMSHGAGRARIRTKMSWMRRLGKSNDTATWARGSCWASSAAAPAEHLGGFGVPQYLCTTILHDCCGSWIDL